MTIGDKGYHICIQLLVERPHLATFSSVLTPSILVCQAEALAFLEEIEAHLSKGVIQEIMSRVPGILYSRLFLEPK